MRRALVLGGTGAIGRATARRLLTAGWQVDLAARVPSHFPSDLEAAGARFVSSDRGDPAQMAAAFGTGADLLVDCVCFTAEDAAHLLPLAREAGSTVMISSKAVYVDRDGNHSNSETKPCFDGPVRETQVFVKRVLDRRPSVFLAHRGAGVDHTTAAANIATLIEVAAESPGARVLNSADPDAPNALEIARTIARQLGHSWEEVLLDDAPADGLGRTPWDAPHPIVLDTTAALELGYVPAGDYAATVADMVDWLVTAARGGEGSDLLPAPGDEYFGPLLDYTAEDRRLGFEC